MSPEERFSDRVENYIRYRPGYPEAVWHTLRTEAGLNPTSTVADIGSGTGISSMLLLQAGCVVHGVEPNAAMRHAAERILATEPNFKSVAGRADATTLPDSSVDLIVAAQAFHWFNTPETRQEFSRMLKPGGKVALIWNERQVDSTPFLIDYEALLLQYGTDYAAIRHENIDAAALASFYVGPYQSWSFENQQTFDFEGLKGRLLSCSYAPAPEHPQHEAMLTELRQIFERHQDKGEVAFRYVTRLNIGR